jgi:hypothetical protein
MSGMPQMDYPMSQQMAMPQMSGMPQMDHPMMQQMGMPQMSGMPQMGMPQMGMPQMGMPQMGMPQMGMPQMSGMNFNNDMGVPMLPQAMMGGGEKKNNGQYQFVKNNKVVEGFSKKSPDFFF